MRELVRKSWPLSLTEEFWIFESLISLPVASLGSMSVISPVHALQLSIVDASELFFPL